MNPFAYIAERIRARHRARQVKRTAADWLATMDELRRIADEHAKRAAGLDIRGYLPLT
jgi:hypothetical protein